MKSAMTIIIATGDPEARATYYAKLLDDHHEVVLALSGGKLVYDGPPGGIVSALALEEIFETNGVR